MSYLSTLPDYPTYPVNHRVASGLALQRSHSMVDMSHRLPLPRLLHRNPDTARHYTLAATREPQLAMEYARIRRQLYPTAPSAKYTLRNYHTFRLGNTRPMTHNRYSHAPIYPMEEWNDRLGLALDRMSWVARSMVDYGALSARSRYLLTPTFVYPLSSRLVAAAV